MHKLPWKAALAAAATAAFLAGCSSGSGDDDGPGSTPPPTSGTEVPGSALDSSAGFVAYVRSLIGSNSETAEPVRVGDVTIPVSDTTEPAN